MLEQLRLIMQALPWTGPAVVGGAVLGLLSMFLAPSRRSKSDRLGMALLLWCLTVVVVVTLSPVRTNYFGVHSTGCDWSVWRPLDYHYWFSAGSRPPNIWLLAPAGLGVMLLDRMWRKILGLIVLVALPVGIETFQKMQPQLKRTCSSQDVVDNWTGLAMGAAVGAVLAILIGIVRAIRSWSKRRADRRRDVVAPAEPQRERYEELQFAGAPVEELTGEPDPDATQIIRAPKHGFDTGDATRVMPTSTPWDARPRDER